MFVLTVGLVSMLGVFATAMAATQTAQQDMIAKQLAQQAMETIYTARETANITWDQIQNIGGAGSPGIFRTGLQPIKRVGTDGIMDTINDGSSLRPDYDLAGAGRDRSDCCGATAAATTSSCGLSNYQRSIAIANTPSADLRSITITIQYTTPRNRFPKTYVLSGFISQYR